MVIPQDRRDIMSYTTLFNCEFYLAALVIAVTGITFTLLHQRTDKLQNKIYMGLLTLMTLNCLSQIITVLAEDLKFSSATTAAIMRFRQWSYFIFHNMLAPVFFFYVIVVCGLSIKNHKTRYILSTIPFVVTELLVFLNPLTNWVYYYDKNNLPRALRSYLEAVSFADTLSDDCNYQMLSRIYGQIADIYHHQRSPSLELDAERKAVDYAWSPPGWQNLADAGICQRGLYP